MIATSQTVTVAAPLGATWDYASDVTRWAEIMPGYQSCTIHDADTSTWVLKIGVGAMVRTVTVNVTVDRWAGPEEVDFTFALKGDPVSGSGTYRAAAAGNAACEVTLAVEVNGSGPMAPMWEAMGGPVLPKFARSFAEELKARIETHCGAATPGTAPAATRLSWWARFAAWLRSWLS